MYSPVSLEESVIRLDDSADGQCLLNGVVGHRAAMPQDDDSAETLPFL